MGTAALHVHPAANRVIADFRERFPLVDLELHPGFGPSQVDLLRRRMLDAAFVNAPLQDEEGLRYLALGTLEIRAAVPEGHPMAALDRIPRSELLKERYITVPRAVDPTLMDHAREEVFGQAELPDPMEVADTTMETRLRLVADGEGFTLTIRPEETDLPVRGVAYRRIAGRTPRVEYGLAWLDSAASSFVASFVEIAERVASDARADETPARRRGGPDRQTQAS